MRGGVHIANLANRIAVMRRGEAVTYETTAEVPGPPFHEHTELLSSSAPDPRVDRCNEVTARRRQVAQ
jgi:ABC-type dipeptide/oligopeptide/nickel transport system ATPase component